MKEKKLMASVILGVALVSLITGIVAAFAEGFTCLIDIGELGYSYDGYDNTIGGIMLGAAALGIAFVAVFFANKKKRFAVNLSLGILLVAYCIAALIALRCTIVFNGGRYIHERSYALFTSYLTAALALMVSTALALAAWLYLTLVKKKEEPAPIEGGSETEKQ